MRRIIWIIIAVVVVTTMVLSVLPPPQPAFPPVETPIGYNVKPASATVDAGFTLSEANTPVATPMLDEKTAFPSPSASYAAAPTSAPGISFDRAPYPPNRNQIELALRLKGKPSLTVTPSAPVSSPTVNSERDFYVLDQTSKEYRTVRARLRKLSPSAYWYAEATSPIQDADLQQSVDFFESRSRPTLNGYFGLHSAPQDGDPRITVLMATIPGVGGYFSSSDMAPTWVNPYSNETGMIYLNTSSTIPGSTSFDSVLAHEFVHLIQYTQSRGGDTWINEGAAELGASSVLPQRGGDSFARYLADTDLGLTDWGETPGESIAHYNAAFLFLTYFAERFGGAKAIGDLNAQGNRGEIGFNAFLANRGQNATFVSIFKDWIVANYLDDPTIGDGRFGYLDERIAVEPKGISSLPATIKADVQSFGVDYFKIQSGRDGADSSPIEIGFKGSSDFLLLGADAKSGRYQWWSNRGDSVDSKLTRAFDLRGLSKATLKYSIWLDIEESFDYGFVEISTDNGASWKLLATPRMTTENPNGGNFGVGYTGPPRKANLPITWQNDEIDLSQYVGSLVLIRFEYVTDDAVSNDGFGLENIDIPEIGFFDDVESGDNAWVADGFIRVDTTDRPRYSVQVIEGLKAPKIEEIALDSQNQGKLLISASVIDQTRGEGIVVAVTALNSLSTNKAPYELSVSGGP